MSEGGEVLVSFRLRATGKVLGCSVALPADADPHLIRRSDLIAHLARAVGVAPEEIELLDLWSKTHELTE